MSNYSYVAVDPRGIESRGTLDVSDQTEALRRIKEMGLFPTKVLAATPSGHRAAQPRLQLPPARRTINHAYPLVTLWPCTGQIN
jgi:type IV pilus assembly protein PilC